MTDVTETQPPEPRPSGPQSSGPQSLKTTPWQSKEGAAIVAAATDLALRVHSHHVRKHSSDDDVVIPYTAHLLGTAAIIVESPLASAEHIAAALLHDSVEDRPDELGITHKHWAAGRAEVQRKLADALHDAKVGNAHVVAALVMHATETRDKQVPDNASDAERRRDWLRRKEQYREQLHDETLSQALVSLADNIYNVRSLVYDLQTPTPEGQQQGDDVWGRFNAGAGDKIAHYLDIAEIMRKNEWNDILVTHLHRAINDLQRLAERQGAWPPATA
jgi:(p)ppGpp synthase/HD superfamily hydrolase